MEMLVHPRAWFEKRRARAEADRWIGHGFESRYQWRVAELTSERERKSCARAIRSVIEELQGSKLPGAAPLRTVALRPHVDVLHEIEARLTDGRAIAAAGMIAVDGLLTSPGSCLFMETDDVRSCLVAVRDKLEVQ